MATKNPHQIYLAAAAKRRAEILKLKRKGAKVKELAQRFGLTRQRIYQIIGPQR